MEIISRVDRPRQSSASRQNWEKDLGASEFPAIETALIDGDLGLRQLRGGHTPAPNWPVFLKFASRYVLVPSAARAGSPCS
jgi:hypothetical protein